jgi:hypothetical protein
LASGAFRKCIPAGAGDQRKMAARHRDLGACYHFEAEKLPRVSRFNHCSIERLVHAANMYRVKTMPIYLTGGDFNKQSSLQHATEAAKFLIELGVAKGDIKIKSEGENTAAEAAKITTALNQLNKPHMLAVVS